MTGPEKLDFIELRREMREGFDAVTHALERLSDRVISLETTRSNQEAVAEAQAAKRLSRRELIAVIGGSLGTFYGLVTLARGIGLF